MKKKIIMYYKEKKKKRNMNTVEKIKSMCQRIFCCYLCPRPNSYISLPSMKRSGRSATYVILIPTHSEGSSLSP